MAVHVYERLEGNLTNYVFKIIVSFDARFPFLGICPSKDKTGKEQSVNSSISVYLILIYTYFVLFWFFPIFYFQHIICE